MIKESTTHFIEQAGQWPTSVALDRHTFVGLGFGRGGGGGGVGEKKTPQT